MKVYVRGNPATQGPLAPRRFLRILAGDNPTPFSKGSGRLELAKAIANSDNPLTARVIVNRVWMHHFGRGIVATPSNFGALGEKPTHPELLDYLADELVRRGWSLKALHRLIVTSATYRMASSPHEGNQKTDPDNRLLWRMNRRRLQAEELRDAVLSVAGRLDFAMGGESAGLDDKRNHRRTVYGTVTRQKSPDILRLFDFPDAKRHSDQRQPTTTPLQQLYLLNSPFVEEQAGLIAEQSADDGSATTEEIARRIFERVLLREPTREELNGAIELAAGDDGTPTRDGRAILAHALLANNEFLFVD
jgi:hypothetical protein